MKSNQIWYTNRPQLELFVDTLFLEKDFMHNGRLAVKMKYFRPSIKNIQVLILHGVLTVWEKILISTEISTETRTYLILFNVEKCIYTLFPQAKITF